MRTARGKLLFDVIYDGDYDLDFTVWVYPNGDISYSFTGFHYVPKSYYMFKSWLLWL